MTPKPTSAKIGPRVATEMCANMSLTNPEYERCIDPESTLKKLIDSNQKYLLEKGKKDLK